MKKRWLSFIMAMVMICLSFAGCGGKKSSKKKEVTSTTKISKKFKGQKLNVFLWPEYIPDSVIKEFEEAYGVTVNVSTYSSNEEMLSKFQNSAAGTYDIVDPSDYMIQYMSKKGMLAKLNKKILTNYKNLNDQYLGQFYDKNNDYSVPFAPGIITIAYDSKVVDKKITKLSELFDSKYKSSLVVLDDPKIVVGMVNKSLGYSLNETNKKNLEKTKEKLMQLKKNIYSLKFEGTQEMLLSGECSVGYIFNGNTAMAQMENEDIKAVFPEEGSYKWIDNLAIPKNSKKQELANTFINYILDAKVDQRIREEIPSTDPNKAGWELVSEDLKKTALDIPKSAWTKSEYAKNLDEDTNKIYNNMYAQFTK